jgi:hypothetical protein
MLKGIVFLGKYLLNTQSNYLLKDIVLISKSIFGAK